MADNTEIEQDSGDYIEQPEEEPDVSDRDVSISFEAISKGKLVDIYNKDGSVIKSGVNLNDTETLIDIYHKYPNARPQSVDLYQFQKDFVDKAMNIFEHSQLLINSSDTGTGKTITTIYMVKDMDIPIIVICPNNVKNIWINQFLIYGVKHYRVFTFNEFSGRLKKGETETTQYIADKMMTRTIRKVGKKNYASVRVNPRFDQFFEKYGEGSGLVVFDEFQSIKNEGTTVTEVSRALLRYCIGTENKKRVLLLSATPFDQRANFETFFRNISFWEGKKMEAINSVYDNVKNLVDKFIASGNDRERYLGELQALNLAYDDIAKGYSRDGKDLFLVESYRVLRNCIGILINVEDIRKVDPAAFNGYDFVRRNGFFILPEDVVELVRQKMSLLYDLNNQQGVWGIDKITVINNTIREIEKLENFLYARLAFEKVCRRNNRGQFDKVIVSMEGPQNCLTVQSLIQDMVDFQKIEKYSSMWLTEPRNREKILDRIGHIREDIRNEGDGNVSTTELLFLDYYANKSVGKSIKLDLLENEMKLDLGYKPKPIMDEIANYVRGQFSEETIAPIISKLIRTNGMSRLAFLTMCLESAGELTAENMEEFERLVKEINFDDRPGVIDSVVITGETENIKKADERFSERDRAFKKFNVDPKCKVLLMTTNVGGVGRSLHNTKVWDEDRYMFISPSFKTIATSQTSGRGYRIGVMGNFYVYTVNGKHIGTAQKNIIEALKGKSDIVDIAIGEGERPEAAPGNWPDYCEVEYGVMAPAADVPDCDANSDLTYSYSKTPAKKKAPVVEDIPQPVRGSGSGRRGGNQLPTTKSTTHRGKKPSSPPPQPVPFEEEYAPVRPKFSIKRRGI